MDVVIVSAARTAIGKFGGSLAKVPARTCMPRRSIPWPCAAPSAWSSSGLTPSPR